MAYIPIERQSGTEGLDAIAKFTQLQQNLQQGALQSDLMSSRLQTEALERQAAQFGLEEAKAASPINRVLKQLELESAQTRNSAQQAALVRMPQEYSQQDQAFDQRQALGDQALAEGNIRQRAMGQALKEQKDAYDTGKMLGPVYMKMMKDSGVTGLPQAAQDLFSGQIGERAAQAMVQMTQTKQQLELRNQAMQVELAKVLNPFRSPEDSMKFVMDVGKVARDNPELLKGYRDKVADPDTKAIIDGALSGVEKYPDLGKAIDQRINEALASDDPAIRDAALNVQALKEGGNIRPQPVYDGAGNPIMQKVPVQGAVPDPTTGKYAPEDMKDEPMTVSASSLIKRDLAKILGPAPSKQQAKASTQPAVKSKGREVVDQLRPFNAKLDSLNLNPKASQHIIDALAMLRMGDRAGASRLASLKSQLTSDQWSVLMDEVDAIDAGR